MAARAAGRAAAGARRRRRRRPGRPAKPKALRRREHRRGRISPPAAGRSPQACTPRRWNSRPGRWYEVGATEYGGPGRPDLGRLRLDPRPGAVLPARRTPTRSPSCRCSTRNPANGGTFTFSDANALNNLAVSHGAAGRPRRPRERCSSSATSATGRGRASSSQTGSPTAWTCGGRRRSRSGSPRAP